MIDLVEAYFFESDSKQEVVDSLKEDLFKSSTELGYDIPVLPKVSIDGLNLKSKGLYESIVTIEAVRELARILNNNTFITNKKDFENSVRERIKSDYDEELKNDNRFYDQEDVFDRAVGLAYIYFGLSLENKGITTSTNKSAEINLYESKCT